MPEYPGPITPALFPASRLANALNDTRNTNTALNGTQSCPLQKWGIEELTLSLGEKTSTSYSDPQHGEVAGGRGGRFFFAPIEEKVTVAWKLKTPENATTLTLTLYRAGSSAPIWHRTLNAVDAQKLKLDGDWDGSFPRGEWVNFPDALVTVEHSPYMLKATAGAGAEEGLVTRWTYLDVLVDKIELTWGGRALLPGGDRGDIDPLYHTRTRADEDAILDALALQKRTNGTLAPQARYEVALPCNQFVTQVFDLSEDHVSSTSALWRSHKKQWGNGPRIPLVAKVYIAKGAGGGVHGGPSARALGKAKFLWDWKSEDEIAALPNHNHANAVERFLTDSLDYRRNENNCPPGSTNCHEDHDGKRGPRSRVLHHLPSVASAHMPGRRRLWAAFATPILEGPHAGCVGVLFWPSRIALDTYVVSVYAPPDGGGGAQNAIDVAGADPAQGFPSLPKAASGTFEILRKIRVRYTRKSAAVQNANLVAIATEYRRAGIVIDWGATQVADELTLANNFNAWWLASANPLHRSPWLAKHRARFEANDQYQAGTGNGTSYGFVAESWDVYARRFKLDAIREYVHKDRTFNTPLKRYNAWLNQGNLAANDHQFLLPFYNELSRPKKAKVDTLYKQKLEFSGPASKESYENVLESAAVQAAQDVTTRFLRQINEHGMLIVHFEAPIGYRQSDQSVFVRPSTQGGVSPSAAAQWEGRGSVHMVFLPQTPLVGEGVKYHTPVTEVIRHEMGHNLFLCHAPSEKGQPEAAGSTTNLHDAQDLRCLMNYDQRSDHLCGYCHLKLRGWATTGPGGQIGHGLVVLHRESAQNKKP